MSQTHKEILALIQKASNPARFTDKLPCPITELTPREFEIFKILAKYCGAMQFIHDETCRSLGYEQATDSKTV